MNGTSLAREKVKLRCVEPRHDPVWRNLIETRDSSLFHSPGWLEVLSRTYGWEPKAYVSMNAEGEPRGGMAFCRIKDIFGERIETLPFSDYCDVLGDVAEDWHCMCAELLKPGIPATVRCLHNTLPARDARFSVPRQAKWHGLDLRPGLEELWRTIPSAGQRAIRKSEHEGIEIVKAVDEDALRSFFDMHLGIRKYKYGYLAQPFRLFQNTWEQFIQRGNGFILLARYGSRTIGGTVFLRWKDTLYYKWNASIPGELQQRPNDRIIWEAMRLAKCEGCSRLDFGLSDCDQEGLLRFKRKFASVEKDILVATSVAARPLDETRAEFKKVLKGLTQVLVDPAVPDVLTERAGDLLYKFFA